MINRVQVVGVALLILLWAAVSTAQDQAFVIVVNKDNPIRSMTVVDLRRIFTKQNRMWSHGESMVPVDWDATSEIRQAFSRQILGRSVREMADFWVQQTMTQGLAPPSTQKSSRAVLRFVASVPGAISYLPPGDVDDTVRVIRMAQKP